MTDHVQTVHNDVAYIQDLMLGARRAALLGGPILVAAGSIYGAASLLAWTASTGDIALAAPLQSWIWMTANAVFCPILYMRMTGLRMAGSPPEGGFRRTVGSAWRGVGCALLTLVFAYSAAGSSLNDGRVWMGSALSLFALNGMVWLVAAAAARRGWMAAVGVGSFGVAIVAGFLINSPAVYLLFAAGLIGLLAAPGLVLIHCSDRPALTHCAAGRLDRRPAAIRTAFHDTERPGHDRPYPDHPRRPRLHEGPGQR